MKIWVVYNEAAGDGISSEELGHAIERGGHAVVAMSEQTDPLDALSTRTADLVVVAGGDGTIRRTAAALIGRGLPLAMLPMGTANNIASSLGVGGALEDVIAAWGRGRLVPVDLCHATGPVMGHFMESVGGGLIAEGIETMDRQVPVKQEPDVMRKQALVTFREVLAGLEALPRRLVLDGEPLDGSYLLVEVLNIPSVGPNFLLAPGAHAADGALDVVLAGEAERPLLDRYLRDRVAGRPAHLELPTRRARSVELSGWDRLHADDEVSSDLRGLPVTLRVATGAIELLLPEVEEEERAASA